MILVDIFRNKENKIYGFTIQNHAESIVCAGVSAIVLTTINALETFTCVEFSLVTDEEKGIIDYSLQPFKETGFDHEADLLLKTMVMGIKQIRDNYPEEINISDCEV